MSTPQQPNQLPEGYELKKKKKPFYQRLGCLIPLAIVAILIIVIAVNTGGSDDDTSGNDQPTATSPAAPNGEAPEEEATENGGDDVPSEYSSALSSAESYLQTSSFSQDGLYDQLTSQFEQFTPEAAQYAVDNVDVDWNEEALEQAESYQETSNMSPAAIYDQLTSQFEQFTPGQAQYAVDNLS